MSSGGARGAATVPAVTHRHGHLPRVALAAADAAAAALAASAAYALRFLAGLAPVEGRTDVLPARYLEALPAATLLLVAAAWLAGLHDARRLGRPPSLADAFRAAAVGAALLAMGALFYWKEFQYSRASLLLTAALFVPALLATRRAALRLLRRLRDDDRLRSRVLVVGGGAPAEALARLFRETEWLAVDVVAVLPVGGANAWPGARTLATIDEACALLARGEAREAFVATPATHSAEVPRFLAALEQTTADVHVIPDLGAAHLVRPGAAVLGDVAVVSVRQRPLFGARAAAKRLLDVLASATLLVLLAPLMLAIALLVKVTSRGPALFVQERMGLDGRPFEMLKFRTMREGAEDATGPVFARRGDPRTTGLGRVLRRLSLDELPQLWNVLRGDMSLVGPRPERAPFIEEFRRRIPGYMLRHAVKAGMTGWAQVHGLRGETALEDRLRYDLEYIDRWTLSFDLEILGRTAVQVVAGRNAY